MAISVCSFVGRDARGFANVARRARWGLIALIGQRGTPDDAPGWFVPGEWYLVLCSRFPVLPCAAEHSNNEFDDPVRLLAGAGQRRPPRVLASTLERAPVAEAAPICDEPSDEHRRYPSAFGIPRFVNILAEFPSHPSPPRRGHGPPGPGSTGVSP